MICWRNNLSKLRERIYKDFKIEEWKDIKGYEGLYQISNLGNRGERR
jgi:hypothetical protein